MFIFSFSLAMVCLAVMALGAIGLFKPFVHLKMPNRIAAAGWLITGLIGFVIVMLNAPPKPSTPGQERKAATVAKPIKWDMVAVSKDLETCKEADGVVQYQLDQEGQIAAYRAAINAKNECLRAFSAGPDRPFECRAAAATGLDYYKTLAEMIDTLDTRPSKTIDIAEAKQIFVRTISQCEAALTGGPE